MVMPILAVENVEASSAFYTDKLGFTQQFAMPGDDGTAMFAMVSFGPGVNFGLSKQPGLENKGVGSVLMVYIPDDMDIDAYYADVKARGTAIDREIADEYWGDRTFSVKDPDGFYISLCKTVRQMSADDVIAAQSQ